MSESVKPKYGIFRWIPMLLCFMLSAFAICWDTAEVTATEVYIDGRFCGWVDSADAVSHEVVRYWERLDAELGENYPLGFTLSYRTVALHNPTRLSDSDCIALVKSAVSENYSEAYMLYVNDTMTVAAKTDDNMTEAVKAVENRLLKNAAGIFDKLELLSGLDTVYQLCPNGYIHSEQEITDMLCPALPEVVVTDIAVRSVAALAPNVDTDETDVSVSSTESETVLSYRYIKTETVDEIIPWQSEIGEDDNMELVCSGVNGLRRVTYEIHYDLSGNETECIETASEILTPAVVIKAEPTGTYIWPCDWKTYGISSKYGGRDLNGYYDFHLGIDLPGAVNTPVYAADGGKVVWSGCTYSYGNSVWIDHGNGIVTLYAHLRKAVVKIGDNVYQGQQIGTMGMTGVATGVHLHFEVRVNDKTDDPLKYLPKVDVVIHN